MISDADPETWRDIPGWEGIYQISNLGRVKSCKVIPSGKVMRLSNKTGDYIRIVLQKKGRKNETHLVHRLVAKLFLPNPSNLPIVNHKDGNKQNNSVSNLEWCTNSYNVRHSMRMHPFQTASMVYYNKFDRPKRIAQIDRNGTVVAVYGSARMAQVSTGVCSRNILQVANRTPFNREGKTRRTAGGYSWRFESEVMMHEL